MIQGAIQGGWGFVWAVYASTWLVLLGYAGFLVFTSRGLSAAPEQSDAPDPGGV